MAANLKPKKNRQKAGENRAYRFVYGRQLQNAAVQHETRSTETKRKRVVGWLALLQKNTKGSTAGGSREQ